MKEIKAIIQPQMLTKVMDTLHEIQGLPGVTVSEVRGFGRNPADEDKGKIMKDYIDSAKKIKLEIVVPDELAHSVATAIQTSAHTGGAGDGLIFISPVDVLMRIRTGRTES